MTWDPDGFRRALRGKHEGAVIDVFGSRIDDERVLRLATLIIPATDRGQGIGGRIMKAITDYADKHGAMVTLSPGHEPDRSEMARKRYVARLVRWYKTFGFVENKGRNKDFRLSDSMYRLPQETR